MNDGLQPPAGPPAGAPSDPAPNLPQLHTAQLDAGQVEQLFRDIEACGRIIEIIPKQAPRGLVPDTAGITLARARDLLAQRAVRGLQIRYFHDGDQWWDTLMLVGDGTFRLVRIRHDFGNTPAAQNPPPG